MVSLTFKVNSLVSCLSCKQDYAYPVQLLSSILIVDGLRVLVKDEAMILGLKEKLPIYLATASDVAPETDPLFWWNHHEQDLPNWVSLVCQSYSCSPRLQQWSMYFLFFLILLVVSKTIVLKITFKLLC